MSLNFHSVWHWTVEAYRIKNSINFHFLIFVLSFKLSQSIAYKCTGLLHTSWAKISRIQLRFFFLAIQRRKGYEKPKKFFTTPTLHFTDPVLLIWRILGAASFLTLSGWMVFVKKKTPTDNQTYDGNLFISFLLYISIRCRDKNLLSIFLLVLIRYIMMLLDESESCVDLAD